ncbi:TPA: hypothetical protein QCY45_004916 [Bacillus cereus]|nr:hypothetical protein [Bacillus cereus]
MLRSLIRARHGYGTKTLWAVMVWNPRGRVERGSFAYRTGNWLIPEEHDGPAFTRRFGSWSSDFNLPIKEDLGLAVSEIFYDTPFYNASPFTIGFRNLLEV